MLFSEYNDFTAHTNNYPIEFARNFVQMLYLVEYRRNPFRLENKFGNNQ